MTAFGWYQREHQTMKMIDTWCTPGTANMRIYITSKHYCTKGIPDDPPKQLIGNSSAYDFYDRYALAPAQYVAVAYAPTLVGFFRYDLDRKDAMIAAGTWVHPKYRGQGLGQALWAKALQKHSPSIVYVQPVTSYGKRFVSNLKKVFDVRFEVYRT